MAVRRRDTPITLAKDGEHSDEAVDSSGRTWVRPQVPTTDPLSVQLRDSNGDPVAVGGGTQYDEDSPHVSGDKLTMAGVVQQSIDGGLTSNNGDRAVLQVDENGFLKVNIKAGGGSGGLTDTQLRASPVPVTQTTQPLPAGASTLAEQQTQTTALQLIDDPVHARNGAFSKAVAIGGELDDTGTVAATEGNVSPARITAQRAVHVNLRDALGAEVSVGGGTQYDEDTPSAAAEKLTMAGVVRKDAAASMVDTDGDRTALQVDANGALRVTGGGGGTEYTEGGVVPATPTGSTVLYERDDALSAVSEAEGQWTHPRVNANGALWVKPDGAIDVNTHAVTGPLTDAQLRASAVPVSGPLTDTQLRASAVPVDTELPSAAALADAAANPTVPTVGADILIWNGTGWDRVRGDTANGVDVDVTRSALPTGASTETTLGTRLSESDFDTKVGSLTETAPTNDTNSSGLNGRLQRIAQRLTSLIALFPAALVGGRFDVNLGAAPATVTIASIPAGNSNIGDVDVATQPARSRTVDAISVAQQTDAIMNGLTALTPKFARINGSTSGDNTLVSAVSTKKIRVIALSIVAAGAVTVNFQTAAAGAMLAGPYTLAANGGIVLPYNPVGWFETVASDLLNMELSAAVTVGGCLTYVEV